MQELPAVLLVAERDGVVEPRPGRAARARVLVFVFCFNIGLSNRNKSVIIKVLVRLLNEKKLVACAHSVIIIIQSVVRISQ